MMTIIFYGVQSKAMRWEDKSILGPWVSDQSSEFLALRRKLTFLIVFQVCAALRTKHATLIHKPGRNTSLDELLNFPDMRYTTIAERTCQCKRSRVRT